jgi:hypothetical protein
VTNGKVDSSKHLRIRSQRVRKAQINALNFGAGFGRAIFVVAVALDFWLKIVQPEQVVRRIFPFTHTAGELEHLRGSLSGEEQRHESNKKFEHGHFLKRKQPAAVPIAIVSAYNMVFEKFLPETKGQEEIFDALCKRE